MFTRHIKQCHLTEHKLLTLKHNQNSGSNTTISEDGYTMTPLKVNARLQNESHRGRNSSGCKLQVAKVGTRAITLSHKAYPFLVLQTPFHKPPIRQRGVAHTPHKKEKKSLLWSSNYFTTKTQCHVAI